MTRRSDATAVRDDVAQRPSRDWWGRHSATLFIFVITAKPVILSAGYPLAGDARISNSEAISDPEILRFAALKM
jgi:hypothetical protein